MDTTRGEVILKKFHDSPLETQVIALAENAADKGHYKESLELLDNLMKLEPKEKKLIVNLSIKIQKEMEAKKKECKK